ncbi:MAG: DUF5606 domain-containing protein [Marinilabiliales bacterium]
MSLKGILAISGKPGLYKHIAQSKNAVIVEDLETGKRFPAYATMKMSALEDIAIYTESEEVPLIDVFKNIKNICGNAPIEFDPKKADASLLKEFMEKVLPDYDRDRVYVSDMKKMFSWYNFLHKHNLLDFEEQDEQAEEEKDKTEPVEEKVEKTDK